MLLAQTAGNIIGSDIYCCKFLFCLSFEYFMLDVTLYCIIISHLIITYLQ